MTLSTILSIFELADIFNADEFGLFYQALPQKRLYVKKEKCSKTRLVAASMTGVRRSMGKVHVTGKSKIL